MTSLATLIGHAAVAVQAVLAGRSLDDALAATPEAVRPGTQAVVFHTLRRLGAAQAVARQLATRAPPPATHALLIVALALLWPATAGEGESYPDHTVVDQAAEAARCLRGSPVGFVNAVLRRFLRERDALVQQAKRDPVALHNHPAWWVDRLRRDWPQHADALLAQAHRPAPMTLRVNLQRTSVAACLHALAEAGHAADAVDVCPSALDARADASHVAVNGATVPAAIVLQRPRAVTALPGFAEGWWSVQDAAAQRAAPLLLDGLARQARVLDACAAPGGKTAHLLEIDPTLRLTALDIDTQRLARVQQNLDRLGLSATLKHGDAGAPESWWDGERFDAILLDAPCSASGIVRRHPDIPWLRRPSDIDAFARRQSALLAAGLGMLAPGGRLLFATCSIFKAEGQDRIDALLRDDALLQRPGMQRLARHPSSPGHLLPLPQNQANAAPHDGFFYALLTT